MRLDEFTDPKEYTPTAGQAEQFLKRLLRLRPDRPPDDLAPSVPRNRKQPQIERRKLFDAL
jgi:hypothetical protein